MINDLLITQIFSWLLVFARVGSALTLLPGVGEVYVPVRVRLSFALAVSALLVPIIGHLLPTAPTAPLALMILLGGEVLIGLYFGLLARIVLTALHTAGFIVATQSSLGSAMLFDITQESQGSSIGSFFALIGMMLLFAADLHHTMLRAVADSYTLIPPGIMPPVEDITEHALRTFSRTFLLAFQVAAPVTIVTFLMYIGAGVLARLMPAMPVFFVITPLQALGAFVILALTLGSSMLWFLNHLDETMFGFTAPM